MHGLGSTQLITALTAEFFIAALQLAASHPHCRHWRRGSRCRVCSVKSRSPRAASGQINYVILEAGQRTFVANRMRIHSSRWLPTFTMPSDRC